MVVTQRPKPITGDEVLNRWPGLVAHMICEALGYFTPANAANAVLRYLEGELNCCEWYSHMSMCRGKDLFDHDEVLKIGRQVIQWSFDRRHGHYGYMSHYPRARALVEHVRAGGKGPVFASWF